MRILSLAVVALALSAGCSDRGDDDAAEILPCSQVWVVGETLPNDYEGCERAGELVKPRLQECTDVEGDMVIHDDRFYASLGGEIMEVPGDDGESESSQSSYFFSC